jgi:hypothetical protein
MWNKILLEDSTLEQIYIVEQKSIRRKRFGIKVYWNKRLVHFGITILWNKM